MRAVGMTKAKWQAKMAAGTQSLQNRHCRQTQPVDSPPGTGLKTNSQQVAGLAAKTAAADDVVLPLAVQLGGGGVQSCWQPERRVQTCLTVPTPPIAFACHCPYPLP